MADELAQAEETAQVEIPTETPELSETTQQAAETPSVPEAPAEPDRGDPRIAMQEERRKRQELEALSKDPNWIYQQAKALGLAQDETPSFAPEQPAYQQPQQASDVASIVETQLDFRETVRNHPEFDPEKGDKGLVKWASTLVDEGHRPSEAVDIILKTISKHAQASAGQKVEETLRARAQSEGLKLQADAIVSTATGNPGAADEERIEAAARNWKDPKSQQAAILEKLKRNMQR